MRTGDAPQEYRVVIDFGHVGLGVQWQAMSQLHLGLSMRNILPWYKQKYSSRSAQSTSQSSTFAVPVNTTVGVAWLSKLGTLSLDNEWYSGSYGGKSNKHINFWFLRGGWEYPLTSAVDLRGGILVPLSTHTSSLGTMKLPSPGFDASVGAGYRWKNFTVNIAFYGDPGQSYVAQDIKFGVMTSVGWKWGT